MNDRLLSERPAKDVAYFGPPCSCGSRRTSRVEGTAVRLCHVCGLRSVIVCRPRCGRFVAYLEPLRETR